MKASKAKLHPKTLRQPLGEISTPMYDLVIIGGGITGATILWDATLRGMKAVLVERNDYASGTTQATSKLIHGGLRYLKNGEFGLVRESLRERRTLARIAPHALRPEGFLFPFYQGKAPGRFVMNSALRLYDLLSFDRNRGIAPDLHLPASRKLSRTEALAEEPGLLHEGLTGASIYYDYANVNPERLCAEFIFSARQRGAAARNYTEATGIVQPAPDGYRVQVRDRKTGEKAVLSGRAVVNAGGPWADHIEGLLSGSTGHKILRSRGIHAVTRRIVHDRTVVLMRPDKTHLFIIPWRDRSIIGTTDVLFDEHPDKLKITRNEVENLLTSVNSLYGAHVSMDDVHYTYAGLRPLVEESNSTSTYNTSRKCEIYHHADKGHRGFFTVLGGKYTTSRALAEKVVDQAAEIIGGTWKPCETGTTALDGGVFHDRHTLESEIQRRYPSLQPEKIETLVARYGSRTWEILARGESTKRESMNGRSESRTFVSENGEKYYGEEIDAIIEREDVTSLADLVFRRSGIGTPGPADSVNTEYLAGRVAAALGWSREEKRRALEEVRSRYGF